MSILPEFKYDVFVSYASGYDEKQGDSPDTELRKWTLDFSKYLRNALRNAFPSPVRTDIFSDIAIFGEEGQRGSCGLDPFQPITKQLRDAVKETAFMVFVMTPEYLNSDWCKDERVWWSEATQAQPYARSFRREIVVEAKHTEKHDWPDLLRGDKGEPIRSISFKSRLRRDFPHGWIRPLDTVPEHSPFFSSVMDLAGVLKNQFSTLRAITESQRAFNKGAIALARGEAKKLYLQADVMETNRFNQIRMDLENASFEVAPDTPESSNLPPPSMEKRNAAVRNILTDCAGNIIVPSADPLLFDGELSSARQRVTSAKSITRKPLPMAVLDDGVSFPNRERCKKKARNLGFDWLDARSGFNPKIVEQWLVETGEGRRP